MEYQLFRLKNGIRAIHQYTDSPVAHFGVIVNTGSRDEEPHEQGMAHFIEHTIFKGTRNRKAFQINNRIEDVGGEINAYTTKEETAIYATFLNEYYSRTIELISDIVLHASFPEKELEKEKEVVIEEINSYNDTPSELIFDEFEELVYDGHPIARNILGTPETVKSFNREAIKQFIRMNYHTNEMVLCSVGKIDPKNFERLIIRYFNEMPENSFPSKRQKYEGYRPRVLEVNKETHQLHCIVGNLSYELAHENRLPMVLLNNILGGNSMNSRLNMALRERNGMAYNIESSYTPYTDTGIFMVYFGTDPENLPRALKIIKKEFDLLREKSMGQLQFSRAKKQLLGQLAISTENHEELMLSIGRSFLYFDKVDPLADVFSKIERLTPHDILQVANEMLTESKLSKLIFR
jgi:predicted Zn-dependent peptidase